MGKKPQNLTGEIANDYQPTFKGYWHTVMIFRFDIVLKATQTSSLVQKRLS